MKYDINQIDDFGTPMARSFHPEFDLLRMLDSIGLSVSEASEKRKRQELPKKILDAWNDYDGFNRLRFTKASDQSK